MQKSSKLTTMALVLLGLVMLGGFGAVTYAMQKQSSDIIKINSQKNKEIAINSSESPTTQVAGETGPTGATGIAGAPGSNGKNGSKGATGSQGIQGASSTEIKSQSMITTTDPNTFIADQVFDLGDVSTVYISITLVSMNTDGEPLGTSPGQILADTRSIYCSRDSGFGHQQVLNSTWGRDVPFDGSFSLPAVTHEMWGVCPRFVKIRLNIMDGDTFNNYTGIKHPTATYRTEISYK